MCLMCKIGALIVAYTILGVPHYKYSIRYPKPYAAIKRVTRFKAALERFKASQILENDCRTHVLEPVWAAAERCASCNQLINYSIEPRNLTRRCPKPKDFPVQTLDSWSQKYDAMLRLLQSICSKL